jgi:hypothetical protein
MPNKIFLIASLAILVGACGSTSSDNSDGDIGTGGTSGTGGTGGAGLLFAVVTGNYVINSASNVDDGCQIGVDKPMGPPDDGLIGVALPLTIDNVSGDTTLGNVAGDPPVPSLGAGKISQNMGTLTSSTMISAAAPSMCTFKRDVTSILTMTADYAFTLQVTRADTMRDMCDTADLMLGDSCTSTWTWALTLQPSADGGASD